MSLRPGVSYLLRIYVDICTTMKDCLHNSWVLPTIDKICGPYRIMWLSKIINKVERIESLMTTISSQLAKIRCYSLGTDPFVPNLLWGVRVLSILGIGQGCLSRCPVCCCEEANQMLMTFVIKYTLWKVLFSLVAAAQQMRLAEVCKRWPGALPVSTNGTAWPQSCRWNQRVVDVYVHSTPPLLWKPWMLNCKPTNPILQSLKLTWT